MNYWFRTNKDCRRSGAYIETCIRKYRENEQRSKEHHRNRLESLRAELRSPHTTKERAAAIVKELEELD